MIGYLTKQQLVKLQGLGVVSCLYGESSTLAHQGDLTVMYFFDKGGIEVAHQTMLTNSEIGFISYRRKWGECVKQKYKHSQRIKYLINNLHLLTDNSKFLVI